MSQMGKLFSLQIRYGTLLGFKPIRSCVTALSSYWTKAGKSGAVLANWQYAQDPAD